MRSPERRRPNRPANGDTKPCPSCGESTCDFNERYRLGGEGVTPAWICDSPQCRYSEVVRKVSTSEARRGLIAESLHLPRRLHREALKCRPLVDPSLTQLSNVRAPSTTRRAGGKHRA